MIDSTLILLAAGIGAAASSTHPVRLEVETHGEMNIVRVVAQSAQLCTAAYELHVLSGPGNNRSVNRGRATIDRTPIVLATVKVRSGNSQEFGAWLDVTPCSGVPYRQAWPADASNG